MSTANHPNTYDAIVIGSGIGGMAAAAALARFAQKRVLVLEQHFVPGGFTQAFERDGFKWDVGIHYVGDMGAGSFGRSLFDYVTDAQVKWQRMPEVYDKIVFPDFTFDIHGTPERYREDLAALFPAEKENLDRYFADVERIEKEAGFYLVRDMFPRWLHPAIAWLTRRGRKLAEMTVLDYMADRFDDPRLIALLLSQWGTYGLPPSQSAFGIHAMVTSGYGSGGWYPVGGGKPIADAVVPIVERAGGRVLLRREVTEILTDRGRACGVKTRTTHAPQSAVEEFRAPVVISDAGAFNTYTKLLRDPRVSEWKEAVREFPKGYSAVQVFLGLNGSPRSLGFNGENHCIYEAYDHDRALDVQLAEPETELTSCFLSFPSLKDPTAARHTAAAMFIVDYDRFVKWQGQPWRKRDPDYYVLKREIERATLAFLERHYPGFGELVECVEVATPLTMEYFDASDRGAIYNIPWVPERFEVPWLGARTPVKNLYLAGADALSHGILPSLMGGIKAAGLAIGPFGFFRLMMAIQKAGRIADSPLQHESVPAERPRGRRLAGE
ncbi:MAG: NAD(P)/FAD-dependent oxidoreductase [Cyanobacteria bacterium J06639_1]